MNTSARSNLLDEYGLFGACCARHGTPLIGVDMDGPEKFLYADTALFYIIQKWGVHRRYFIFYDINCSYRINCEVYDFKIFRMF